MTDFKNLCTSTEHAVRGFFKHLYKLIPCEYRLHYNENESVDTMRQFFDQELTWDNRLHYKAAKIKFDDRTSPWIALVWNKDGIRPSENNFRKFDTSIKIGNNRPIKGKGTYVRLLMNVAIFSNSMTALDEFQEVFLLNVCPDDAAIACKHPYLEDFNVNILDMDITTNMKLPRTEGTLCYGVASFILEYPIVGQVDKNTGIIQMINTDILELDTEKLLVNFTVSDP